MMDWLRDLLGLPAALTGSIQDSASSSTLCAIIAACSKATDGRSAREGLSGAPPVIVYASAEAHSSVEKGALSPESVPTMCTRSNARRRWSGPEALADAIREDRAAGRIPACIVACLGTTGLGAWDPIADIGRIAKAEQIHLHVDAAWAGSALILPEVRSRAEMENVDSFVFNPHKWLFTNFDCSAFYMRDPSALTRALSLTPAYLESRAAGQVPDTATGASLWAADFVRSSFGSFCVRTVRKACAKKSVTTSLGRNALQSSYEGREGLN